MHESCIFLLCFSELKTLEFDDPSCFFFGTVSALTELTRAKAIPPLENLLVNDNETHLHVSSEEEGYGMRANQL